jgi:dihydrodipicolinate synthase/N-acetylneuraminate lyase
MTHEETKAADAVRPSAGSNPEVVVTRAGRMRIDAPVIETTDQAAPPRAVCDYHAIKGVLPTVLTPYDENEDIDTEALEAEVKYLLEAGVHGLVLLGSFGESPYLNDAEREIVIRTAVELADGAVPVVVGITSPSTHQAAGQLRQAKRLGASAVMVCLPQYYKLEFADVKLHYARLGELGLPIFYYHYPAVSGLDLRPAQIAELLALENVVGIKESTLDLHAIRRHIALTRELDRIYLAGSEFIFTQFMELGGHGTVSAGSLLMPRTAVAMHQAYQSGEKTKARELQAKLFEAMPALKAMNAPIALVRPAFLLALRQGLEIKVDAAPTHARLKAALARRGVPIKPIARSPLPALTDADERAVEQAMNTIRQIEP